MGHEIFVIGLLKSLYRRFEAECTRNNYRSKAVLAEIGKEGSFTLLPVGQDAKHALHAYVDRLESYESGFVLVLPYAELSDELEGELATLSGLGCKVERAVNGSDGWPEIRKKQRPDTSCLNAIYARLLACLPFHPQGNQGTVADHFRAVSHENMQVRICNAVYDRCDAVAPYRRTFMKEVMNALSEYVGNGESGRIDAFFRARGIEHAQTGGINTTLQVLVKGAEVHKKTSNTHLKKGDKTTPEAAVRIYYQLFSYANIPYVAVLYAGPHPDQDLSWTLELE